MAGVALFDQLLERDWVRWERSALTLTASGSAAISGFGVTSAAGATLKWCTDWTEHRPHLAGALGLALTQTLVEQGAVEPRPNSRVVICTGEPTVWLTDIGQRTAGAAAQSVLSLKCS